MYLNGAVPQAKVANPLVLDGVNAGLRLIEEGGRIVIHFKQVPELDKGATALVTTDLLGRAQIPDLPFEHPDGARLVLDTDYLGKSRSPAQPSPGPFEKPGSGQVTLIVWGIP